MTSFVCERLGPQHDRESFACGVPELDQYLKRRARQDVDRHVAAVYVMTPADQPRRLAGFYTLSAASVLLADLPREVAKKLPHYPAIPAVLIGRLARDVNFKGLGEQLLMDALARASKLSADVAAAVVLVDAKNEQARDFYARHGFHEIAGSPNRMFLTMKTVKKLFRSR